MTELANIQCRSLDLMAASQRSQQEAFHQLTKASKDKANNAMFASIKNYDGKIDRFSKTGLTRSIKLAR